MIKKNKKTLTTKEKCQLQKFNESDQSNKNKLNDIQFICQNININNVKDHLQLLSSKDQHQQFQQVESCINKKEAIDICISRDCGEKPYVCDDRKCICRRFHQKCQKQDLKYLQRQTSKKIEEEKQKIRIQIMKSKFVDVLSIQYLRKMIQKDELESLSSSQIKLYKHSKNQQSSTNYTGQLPILFNQARTNLGELQKLNIIPVDQENQVQIYELDQSIHLFPCKKILKVSFALLAFYFLNTQFQWHKYYPIFKMGKIIQNQQQMNQTNNKIQEISQNSQAQLVNLNQTNEKAIKYIKQECQANQIKIMQENQDSTKKIVNQKKQELEKLKQQNEQEIKNEAIKNSKIQEELQKNLSQCQIMLENSQKGQKQKSQQLEKARNDIYSLRQRLRKQQSKGCQIF